ncbi:TMEM43 family protein [Coraliomargarita parva]|uniref:TMEM43 family protein n=1 Tax=Coraliomargarita parva TaxID=3014050 RepID=UPI0022B44114|nr:TMEM43 family protein [Coraliomargarita parva]
MAPDSFSEVSSASWFSRIGGAFKGILIGIIAVLVAVALLTWNEGRAVKRYKTLKEGAGAVVAVSPESVLPGNEGKLVHLSGHALAGSTASDPLFKVEVPALALNREVEMYQWKEKTSKETKKKLGGGTETVTTYDYTKSWSAQHIDSSRFKHPQEHANPSEIRFRNESFVAIPVQLGAFTLTTSQIRMIGTSETYTFPSDYSPPSNLGEHTQSPTTLYFGKNPDSPEIGDIRISFKVAPEQDISIVAAQTGNSFQAYQTKAGGTIHLLETGLVSAPAMIQIAQDSNKFLTWVLRGVGLVILFIGFNMILAPISVMADVVPFIGNLVEAGTGLIALLLAGLVGLVTIAVAWIVFRPILAISLLVVGIACAYLIFSKIKSAKS